MVPDHSKHDYGVGATEKSINILEMICERDGTKLSEIQSELDLSKSSVYSHLQTLLKTGLAVKEGEQYYVSIRSAWFAEHAEIRKPEYELAKQTVDSLVAEIGEEVTFAVEENNRVVVYYITLPTEQNPTFFRGKRSFMHNTSVGKSMLSMYDEDKLSDVVDQWGLPSRTETTITSLKALQDELDTVRQRGFATTEEEFEQGLRSVAVPVMYPDGRVFGSLSVIVPTYRVSSQILVDLIGPTIQEFANDLEAEIQKELY